MQVDHLLEELMFDELGKVNNNLMPLLKQVFELGQRTPANTEEVQLYTPDQQRVADFLVRRMNDGIGAGMDPIGFMIASYEYMGNQLKNLQNSDAQKLWLYCVKFVQDQRIHCAEDVYQSDRVIENAYEFVEGVCDIVGYQDIDNR